MVEAAALEAVVPQEAGNMNFTRVIKHLFYPGWWLQRDFPPQDMQRIESAIKTSEEKHSGEIRFAIESSLPLKALWRNEPMHERAIEVFSLLRVWDTEDNNGVLIYLLLADKKVEITADRNINKVVKQSDWELICRLMENYFKQELFAEGVIQGIEEISKLLEEHFPAHHKNENELPNKPIIL